MTEATLIERGDVIRPGDPPMVERYRAGKKRRFRPRPD